MARKDRKELYNIFSTGKRPTADDFKDLIDSGINLDEDGLQVPGDQNPLELVTKGTELRYLDFSEIPYQPVWRISALSQDDIKGLSIRNDDDEGIFINNDGCTGINTGNPTAQLHVYPTREDALFIHRTDLPIKEDPKEIPVGLQVKANGTVAIGCPPDKSYKVTIGESTCLKADTVCEGKLTLQGGGLVKEKLVCSKALEVSGGAVIKTGKVDAQKGLTVKGDLLKVESGAELGGTSVTVKAKLIAQNPAEFSNTLSVSKTLTATGGIQVPKTASIQSAGTVSLSNGLAISAGGLTAGDGAEVSGKDLVVKSSLDARNGGTVKGELKILDKLVIDKNAAFSVESSLELGKDRDTKVNVNGMLIAESKTELIGEVETYDNIRFGAGLVNAYFEGNTAGKGIISLVKDDKAVPEGHFNFSVTSEGANKILTIFYSATSEMNNLFSDFDSFKSKNAGAAGFSLALARKGGWGLMRNFSIDLTSGQSAYKVFRLTMNPLNIIYSGNSLTAPAFAIKVNTDPNVTDFTIELSAQTLTIIYPVDDPATDPVSKIDYLLHNWEKWKSENPGAASDFYITRNGGTAADLCKDEAGTLGAAGPGDRYFTGCFKTTEVVVEGALGFDKSDIYVTAISSDTTMENASDNALVTQKAVKTFIDNGVAKGLETVKSEVAAAKITIGKKADKTALTALTKEVKAKAGQQKIKGVDFIVDQKNVLNDISAQNLLFSAESHGLFTVRVTHGTAADVTVGLFSIFGTGEIIKIAGDKFSTIGAHTDTFNIFYENNKLTVENKLGSNCKAFFSYLGD